MPSLFGILQAFARGSPAGGGARRWAIAAASSLFGATRTYFREINTASADDEATGSVSAMASAWSPMGRRSCRCRLASPTQNDPFCMPELMVATVATAAQIGGSRSLPAATPGNRVDGFQAVADLAAADG